MDHPVEDYYDMPVELLPSANFAGRPTSDISMLGGLLTMIISSSSEEDNEDDSEDIAPQLRPRTPPQPFQALPESLERPKIMVTSPPSDDVRPSRLKSLSNDVKVLQRPRLRRKAQTAPVGTVDLEPPLEPRRATSARLGYSNSNKKRQLQPYNEDDRSWTMRGLCSNQGSGPQEALPTLSKQEQRLLATETDQGQDEDSSSLVEQLPGSFSDKARIRETLDKKRVRTLNTALADYGAKTLSGSPSSMLSTPRELYATPEQLATSETMDSPCTSRSFKRRSGKSIKSISPKARSSFIQSGMRSSNEPKREDNTKDADAAKRQRIYLPGPIMLAQHPAQLRKDSVATLDPSSVDSKLYSPGRRMSDILGLDTIVTFFEEVSVVAEVTDATLDQYWLHESESSDNTVEDVDTRKESITSVEETPPQIPWVIRTPRGSKFSFSSASSTKPPPEKRKRNRLRDFLSPGLPGSVFPKAPASWGQMTDSS
jgi:hypothetical protein